MAKRSLRRLIHQVLPVLRWGAEGRRHARPTRVRAPARRLTVELLEDRTTPTTLAPVSLFNPTLPPSDSTGGVSQALISADGRVTVFTSTAPNLIDDQVDTALASNIFTYDVQAQTTSLISHVPDNDTTGANGDSLNPRISSDGRFIVYESAASDLVTGQTGPRGQYNVFLYDGMTGTNTLISHRFGSDTIAANDSSTTSYTTGFGFGLNGTRYFLFSSNATDLVEGQSGSNDLNLFLYDTATDTTTLVSHNTGSLLVGANDATEDADLTPDGNFVVFQSFATDVVPGQTGDKDNIFLYDASTGSNELISGVFDGFENSVTEAAGFSFQPSISDDGGVISYISDATNLVDQQSTSDPGNITFRNIYAYFTFDGTTALVSGENGSASVTANDNSAQAVVSGDGNTIAFISDATNLTPDQGDNTGNVFLYDSSSGTLTLASHPSDSSTTAAGGVLLNQTLAFGDLSLSADGSFVCYESGARDVVTGQDGVDGPDNVFVYDSLSGENQLVSRVFDEPTTTGDQPSLYARISANGSIVTFLSYADNFDSDINIADADQNLFDFLVDQGDGMGFGPVLLSTSAFQASASSQVYGTSADGRYVVFTTNDLNVVPNQVSSNFGQNVFLLDQDTGLTTLVSHVPGAPATSGDFASTSPAISADGNWVAFVSKADDLVAGENGGSGLPSEQVYLFHRPSGAITLVSHDVAALTTIGSDDSFDPVISADGRFVAYEGFASDLLRNFAEPNPGVAVDNVYLYDRTTGANTLVSHAAGAPLLGGAFGSSFPDINADGRFVTYDSDATTLVAGAAISPAHNVYLFDRLTGTSTLVSHVVSSTTTSPTVSSTDPVISPDGGFVAFVSFATDLVPGQQPSSYTNVFLYDNRALVSGSPNPNYRRIRLVSGVNGSATVPANGFSDSPVPDYDGSRVAFRSDAPNVVAGQVPVPDFTSNIFLYANQQIPTVALVSHAAGDPLTAALGDSECPDIDGEGDLVVYLSTAADLVPDQQTSGFDNVFLYSAGLGANALLSGENGSPVDCGGTPTFQAVISEDPVVTFNGNGSLLTGVGGTSIGYINRLVELVLSPNTVGAGTPAGSLVGYLSVDSAFAGQFLPPVYRLPAAESNNALFAVTGSAGGRASLLTQFQGSPTAVQTYQVRVHVNIGFGDYAAYLQVYGAAPDNGPPPPPPPPHGITAQLVPVKASRRKIRLVVRVFDAINGAQLREFASPFQTQAFRNIQVSVFDGNGDGISDEILVTARKGKRKVRATYSG
jgi:hypothetical protein